MASAAVIAAALLVMGMATAALLPPDTVAADGAGGGPSDSGVTTEVAGAVETKADDGGVEIGDAVTARRDGSAEPAPTEHLTVVHVSVSVCGARSAGSGVVIADGLLLTAAHVVGDAELVRIDQGHISVTGEVLGVLGDGRDLALVAVDAPMATPLAAAPLPAIDETITLVGHPGAGPRTVAVGARVEIAPVVATLAGDGEIAGVDVGIDAGISGGPAVDHTGTMVGIVVAKEVATDTALVVGTPDLDGIRRAALMPGSCRESA